MKLTIVFLTVGFLQVGAHGLSQTVTFSGKDVPLGKVFSIIKEQTGYVVFYDYAALSGSKPVTLTVKGVPLQYFLDKVLKGQLLDYTIKKKTIVIKLKEEDSDFMGIPDNSLYADISSIKINGKVLNAKGEELPGATIRVKGTNNMTSAGARGAFFIQLPGKEAVLIVSCVGYKTKEVAVSGNEENLVVRLEPDVVTLEDVAIVTTGYQNIPKERATGSFEVIDNKKLNLITGTDILKRLEGNVTGFDFNNYKYATSSSNPVKPGVLANLTIRGPNTLFGSSKSGSRVLVVIDGVEMIEDANSIYTENQIGKINPNDVENITILRDAAAVSVYGSRAANGVIVMTTKKGKFDQPLQVSFNSNVGITEKPDLFYFKRTSVADFIEFQKYLYSQGFYDYKLADPSSNSGYFSSESIVPLAVEILEQQKNDLITTDQANAQLAALAKNDVRNDLKKYVQRTALVSSNNLALSGGSKQIAYRFSLGYDKTYNNTVTSDNDRITLNSNVGIKPLKNLDIQLGIAYSRNNMNDQSSLSAINEAAPNSLMPYDRLADENGKPLPVIKLNGSGAPGLRPGYIDTVGSGRLQDLNYRPLQDMYEGYRKTRAQDFDLSLNTTFRLSKVFSTNVLYSFHSAATNSANVQSADSYVARYLMSLFTASPNSSTPYKKSLPFGGLYNPSVDNLMGHTLRGQLNINKTWDSKHNLTAVAGAAFFSSESTTRTDMYYGYDASTKTFQPYLDYNANLSTYDESPVPLSPAGGGPRGIAIPVGFRDSYLRTTKFYVNGAYSYENRYTISGSIAKDASNVFGTDANKSFKPYYHAGAKWNIQNERFYNLSWLPVLSMRATYGYNGNLNYTYLPNPYVMYTGINSITGDRTGGLTGTSNQHLRPERQGMLNLGLDFGVKGGRVTGSIEVYHKRNVDLIGPKNVDPLTGAITQQFNTADMTGKGIDVNISTINIKRGDFTWSSNWLISHNRVKITKIYVSTLSSALSIVPGSDDATNTTYVKLEGNDVNTLYAFRWAGLSPVDGSPLGYFNGAVSNDYYGILFGTDEVSSLPSIRAVGSATPKVFGAIRQTLTYKTFSVSANMIYKLGYYFRRSNMSRVNYNFMIQSVIPAPLEYYERWQKPGDEQHTNVPVFSYPPDPLFDTFYRNADINVLKADHLRLQSISFSYSFSRSRGILKNLGLYGNIQSLGLLWRANKEGIDPDVLDIPMPRTYAIGLNKTF